MTNLSIQDMLCDIPEIYVDEITRQWQALLTEDKESFHYQIEQRGLPTPIWISRGLPEDGMRAWKCLQAELEAIPSNHPFCIYIHIPFCDAHCPFCDCYAFALKKNQDYHIRRYTDCLIAEMNLWAEQGNLSDRPVSTVHLGGGIPTMLGAACLQQLVDTIWNNFHVTAETEWALETTSSSLNKETFIALQQMGFRRLHIGVQSLQNEVRTAINRRESSVQVMKKIEKAITMGWIVSVDVIVGLPFQTAHGLLTDLNRLINIGVEGFSIYELQQSSRNRRFFQQYLLDNVPVVKRYLLFQLAYQHLLTNGYTSNVFNHLSKGRDRNLYFTYPQRDEDLLAIGTIADGSFNNFHYRHPLYLPYLQGDIKCMPTLQGGLRRTAREDLLHKLEVQILSGTISSQLFSHILGNNVAELLLQKWMKNGLIELGTTDGMYTLSPNGAWFADQLLQEVRCCSNE